MKKNAPWYVVYTKPRWEKKVAANLTEKSIENYCPLNKVTRQWSDRRKIVLEPLFKGYVFVRVEEKDQLSVRQVEGVVNYVHWMGKPGLVKATEIETIRKFMNEFKNVEVLSAGIETDDTVMIKQGLFMNYKGIVLEVLGNKARVMISSMGVQLRALFEARNLQKLTPR